MGKKPRALAMPKTVNQRHAEGHIRPTHNPPQICLFYAVPPLRWHGRIATGSYYLVIRARQSNLELKSTLYSENEEADDLRDWES